MDRAVLPCGAIAGVSLLGWSWLQAEGPRLAANTLIHLSRPLWPLVLEELLPGQHWYQSVWTLGGAFILWHSWREVIWVVQAILGILYWLLCLVGSSLEAFTRCWQQVLTSRLGGRQPPGPCTATEQEGVFTWQVMAVVAGAAPLPLGTFVLVSRPPEWDEVLVIGFSEDQTIALCRTTVTDGTDWAWVLVHMNGLHLRLVHVAADGSHRAPPGVDENHVNWICIPPAGAQPWRPGAPEMANRTVEGNMILTQYRMNPGQWIVNQPGVSGDLQPMAMQLPGPIGPGGAGGGALGGGPGGAPALGVGAPLGGQTQLPDLKALEDAVTQLQAMALSPSSARHGRGRSQKKDKEKKKKKKRSKKKKSRSSSSSSSSSRSRSASASSGSSGGKKRPLRLREDGKDRKVPLSSLTHVDQLKLKKRGDLVAFAARHPGALTAHFLASVFTRLSKGSLTRSSQLRQVSVTSWAHQFSGLTEIRDMKEVATLAEILDMVNRKEIAQALDVLCQRILAIQAAKQKGGTWERAEAIELVDNRKALASTSMLALTNQ